MISYDKNFAPQEVKELSKRGNKPSSQYQNKLSSRKGGDSNNNSNNFNKYNEIQTPSLRNSNINENVNHNEFYENLPESSDFTKKTFVQREDKQLMESAPKFKTGYNAEPYSGNEIDYSSKFNNMSRPNFNNSNIKIKPTNPNDNSNDNNLMNTNKLLLGKIKKATNEAYSGKGTDYLIENNTEKSRGGGLTNYKNSNNNNNNNEGEEEDLDESLSSYAPSERTKSTVLLFL